MTLKDLTGTEETGFTAIQNDVLGVCCAVFLHGFSNVLLNVFLPTYILCDDEMIGPQGEVVGITVGHATAF